MRFLLFFTTCSIFISSTLIGQTLCYTAPLQIHIEKTDKTVKIKPQKQTIKAKLLTKLLKRSLHRINTEDHQKKLVNILGYLSLSMGVLAALFLLLTGIVVSGVGAFAVFSILFMVGAVITGIISLIQRKNLTDKKGATKAPAILGIILGGGLIIMIIVVLATFTFSYSG